MDPISSSGSTPSLDIASTGVILVDHGSRRAASNAQLVETAELYRSLSQWEIVEPAHMELAEPSIQTAVDRCVERGARHIVVFPYLLAPGRHWDRDIPRLAAEAVRRHEGVTHVVTAPLGVHEFLMRVVDARINHCLQHVAGEAPACDLCQDGGGCREK